MSCCRCCCRCFCQSKEDRQARMWFDQKMIESIQKRIGQESKQSFFLWLPERCPETNKLYWLRRIEKVFVITGWKYFYSPWCPRGLVVSTESLVRFEV